MTKNSRTDREYYELMLNALAGVEDDLVANDAPIDAINAVRKALALCTADFRNRFK